MESLQDRGRSLRVKERRHYTEDCLQDEEIEGRRLFSVEEKLTSNRFGNFFVKEMKGEDFSLKYLQEHGLEDPLVFKEKSGLGMRMPSDNFTVNDVRQCVGSRRMLDVMDVTTQRDIEMPMKDWCKYFENTNREKLLNVISLEFSHTRLEHYVESPTVVRQVDWIDWMWPPHLKKSQTEATNAIEDMKYPKVQKYCLMSVKGCFTDFHIDFGGTSVWYHIIRGKKIFWLIPPTEENLTLYEQWVLSGKQGDIFFGDTVEKCAQIELKAGYTFFIPTGWIHAVYTPEDTLVFGGNFLHSFAIERQLRIADIEDATHVPMKFRYPFYVEMLWYVLQRYVHCIVGKNHLVCDEDGQPISPSKFLPKKENITVNAKPANNASVISSYKGETVDVKLLQSYVKLSHPHAPRVTNPNIDIRKYHSISTKTNKNSKDVESIIKEEGWSVFPDTESPDWSINEEVLEKSKESKKLTKFELSGLRAIIHWLQRLPTNKKCVPELIAEPEALLLDVKKLLHEHKNDDPQLACTGIPVLEEQTSKKSNIKPRASLSSGKKEKSLKNISNKHHSANKRRRTRCKKCEACLRSDCRDCHYCMDMKKYGGPGRSKQSCVSRQCMAPVLPHAACCTICAKDGFENRNDYNNSESTSLMECSQCWEIVHPACLRQRFPDLHQGVVNDDLPNSWECPKCCRDRKPEGIKPRQLKSGRLKFSDTINPVQVKESEDVYSSDTEHLNLKKSISPDTNAEKMAGITDKPPVRKKAKFEIIVGEEGNSSSSEPEIEMEEESSLASENKVEEKDLYSSSPRQNSRFLEQYRCECAQLKEQSNQTHVRSCAKYPLNMNVNNQQVSIDNHNKQHHLDSVPGVTNEHGETAQEQVVRSLRGLENNSNNQYTTLLEGFKKCVVKVKKINSESSPRRDKTVASLQDEGQIDDSITEKFTTDSDTNKQTWDERSIPPHAPRITMTLRNNPNRQKLKCIMKQAPIEERQASKNGSNNIALIKDVMLPVFHYLSAADLATCQLVCKIWNHWINDPVLWKYLNFSHKKITAKTLMATVQRQPVSLNLSWTNISKHQLSWLVARLLQLETLFLKGCSTAIVSSLCTCYCPLLSSLDISWVEGLTDSFIRKLLASPPDSKPGFGESKTRLCQLQELRVAGTDVSDISIRLFVHHLSQLSHLDLSHCHKVTDMGIAILGSTKYKQLVALNVSSCANITNTSLEALKHCTKLSYLNMQECSQVTDAACQNFVAQSQQQLMTREEKLIEKQW